MHHPHRASVLVWLFYGGAMTSLVTIGCSRRHPDSAPPAASDGLPVAPPGATGAFAAGRSEPPGTSEETPTAVAVPDSGTVAPWPPGSGPDADGGVPL
jgi:hypothetical protein